jgi:streptogramin lyase
MARRTPSGALWFTEAEGNKIGRITPPLPTSKD